MADPVRATAVIAELASRGIRISLDDFGTGYSSLTSLKRLNVHEIKIDRTFVVNLGPDCPDAAIVRSTIELARTLDLRVVAEGVETGEVLEQLRCSDATWPKAATSVGPSRLTSSPPGSTTASRRIV